MNNTIEFPARDSNKWIEPAELRALLKTNLGLNARQVTVKKDSSLRYLSIIIRDAGVDIGKVKQFAKGFSTWSMDMTDYVTGQSVNVYLTREVEDALAAPFLQVIEAAALPGDRAGLEILPGFMIWNIDGWVHLSARGSQDRTTNVGLFDVKMKTPWAIRSLALNLALLKARAGNTF